MFVLCFLLHRAIVPHPLTSFFLPESHFHEKVTHMTSASNARIRSFFEFDPLDFIDEVVIATSEYINGGLASLTAVVDLQDVAARARSDFLQQLNKRLQKSLNVNSDLLEMFLMRNIFWIDVDVDLAFEFSRSDPQNLEPEPDDADETELDKQLESLRAEIGKELARRMQLQEQIRANSEREMVASIVAERETDVTELIHDIKSLPVEEVTRACSVLESFREIPERPHRFIFD